MALQSLAIALAFLAQLGSPLQVTPNSPCSSFCVDSNDLDFSDPNSSNTANKDIACYDKDFTTSPAGQKFQRCMSCLQSSTFAQGTENDQGWFLYNLRYTVDYCVLGFPNATGIASTPCSTSFACGGLEKALTYDRLAPGPLDSFGYCAADGGSMSGTTLTRCHSCVAATDGQDVMANFIVALDAGCQQRPSGSIPIGLNDTIFSRNNIGIVAAQATTTASPSKGGLPLGAIIGIVIGVIAILLIVAGVFFIRHRKQRNRRARQEAVMSAGRPGRAQHQRGSSLSFKCKTPRTATQGPSGMVSPIAEEKGYFEETVRDVEPSSRHSVWSAQSLNKTRPKNPPGVQLHSLTTSISEKAPKPAPQSQHFSPQSLNAFTPSGEDSTPFPESAASAKSTSQLLPLKSYNPAEFSSPSLQMGGHIADAMSTNPYSSPSSAGTASPLMSRNWDQKKPIWDKPTPPPPPSAGRQVLNVISPLSPVKEKKGSSSPSGSPVESLPITFAFKAPPRR